MCFSVSILEDGVCEQDRVETFTVTVRPQSPEVEIPHARKVATVFLEDSAVCSESGYISHCHLDRKLVHPVTQHI